MEETLAHYGVPGMKWGVRKERRAEAKRQAKIKGTPEWHKRQKRIKNAVSASASILLFANSPIGRGLINAGRDYINRKMALNYSHKMNLKYGGIPDNAVTKGLDFAKKRFGAYNISSL